MPKNKKDPPQEEYSAMAERYIPLFLDFNETTQDLTDEECGRLIRAVVRYANGEDTESLLTGVERIAFRFMKGNVDRNIQLSETRADAGRKGAAVTNGKIRHTPAKPGKKTTNTKTKTDTKTKTETKTETDIETKQAPGTESALDTRPDTEPNTEPFLPDGEAADIQNGHNQVLEAAQDAGFKSSPAERAGLLRLCADFGPDKTVRGIGECVRHSAPTLAYLEAVLKGTGKKKPPSSDSPTYRQRDYTGEQDTAVTRMMTIDW